MDGWMDAGRDNGPRAWRPGPIGGGAGPFLGRALREVGWYSWFQQPAMGERGSAVKPMSGPPPLTGTDTERQEVVREEVAALGEIAME